LDSTEIFSTFGLANSLAGFLVGPLVLAMAMVMQNLAVREGRGSRFSVIAMAAPPLLCLLFCLLLTRSRSAEIGLFCAAAVLGRAAALALGLWNLLGPAAIVENGEPDKVRRRHDSREAILATQGEDAAPAPTRLGWLVVSAASGLVMVLMVGDMNLFKGDLF